VHDDHSICYLSLTVREILKPPLDLDDRLQLYPKSSRHSHNNINPRILALGAPSSLDDEPDRSSLPRSTLHISTRGSPHGSNHILDLPLDERLCVVLEPMSMRPALTLKIYYNSPLPHRLSRLVPSYWCRGNKKVCATLGD
jgi:hypothetical protein